MIIFKRKLLMFCEGEGDGGGGAGGSGGAGAGGAAGDGGGTSWLEGLPEDIGSNPNVAKFKSPADLAKSYIHLSRQMGKDKVALPGENATDEDWNNFFKAVGRPDDPTAYELAAPEELPEGYQYPKALEDNFRKWAHKQGLSAKQTKGLWAELTGHTVSSWKDQRGRMTVENQKVWDLVKQEWGANFNTRKELAQRGLAALNKGVAKELQVPRQLLDNPRFLHLFARMGEAAREDMLGDGRMATGDTRSTPELKARLQELMADPAYQDKKNPAHKKVYEEVTSIFKILHPD
jgi:hypothetical protein